MSVAPLHRTASSPHRGSVEVATLVALYAVYEIVRGQGHATVAAARAHTDWIVHLEQRFHVFGERAVQHAADAVPGAPTLLGIAYIALHFLGTTAFLVWLYRRHRERFALVRNTMIAATGIALTLYVVFPVAPPRLAALGFVDTVSKHAGVNLSSDVLGSLYNPFAAVPSLHFGYALLVGVTIAAVARRRVVRVLALAYPLVMLFVIVATGNHFFFDAAGGALAVGAGYLIATWVGAARREPQRRTAAGSAALPC
ncbi:MAG: phosphatase PAP2 family protein [Actinobacteria bacterium]|nr:MAG: phosphatase PAP2 family protein [Actinomycetota bacterium]